MVLINAEAASLIAMNGMLVIPNYVVLYKPTSKSGERTFEVVVDDPVKGRA